MKGSTCHSHPMNMKYWKLVSLNRDLGEGASGIENKPACLACTLLLAFIAGECSGSTCWTHC